MQISLSPMRSDSTLSVDRLGDALIINGTVFDFGPLPEGGVLPRAAVDCEWLASDVTRQGGALCLSLILPHGPIPFPPPPEAHAVLFPALIEMTENGPVALPSYTAPIDHIGEADE